MPSRKLKLELWTPGIQFYLPTQQPFLWMSKGNVKVDKCLSSSCIRRRKSKAFVSFYSSKVTSLVLESF